jgi:adenosylcobinamide-GDP ribazoletransferase
LWTDGLRLALTTFTVAPVAGPSRLDRAVAGWAMRFAAAIGALLGLTLGAGLALMLAAGAPALLAGVLTVGLAALLSRGLHLDGLADTVDGLGSYGSRERTLEIMKSPEVGPFGVVVLVLVLLVQAVALADLAALPWPSLLIAVASAYAVGRFAAALGCARGMPAARPDGLGALVAGTVGPVALAVNAVAVGLVAIAAVPGRPWQGPLAVAASIAVVIALRHHLVRRLGGITGDVLGFLVEVGTTVMLIGLVLG